MAGRRAPGVLHFPFLRSALFTLFRKPCLPPKSCLTRGAPPAYSPPTPPRPGRWQELWETACGLMMESIKHGEQYGHIVEDIFSKLKSKMTQESISGAAGPQGGGRAHSRSGCSCRLLTGHRG